MPYTAAACPSCERRMVATPKPASEMTPEERAAQWSPEWAAGKNPRNSGVVGAIIAAVIIAGMFFLCMASGKETVEEQRARERRQEMKPLHDEMERKQREGKTREQAAQEIIDEEVRRQERQKRQQQNR